MKTSWQTISNILRKDGVVIIPTDTLYGIVGKATSPKAVERVYQIKGRDKGKPCIVLITSFDDLKNFGIDIEKISGGEWAAFLRHVWPGKVSVVLPCASHALRYLHRGTGSIAFRMVGPRNKNLFTLIKEVGPLVAPSANPEGHAPARTADEAKKYFNTAVDAYISGGIRDTAPSTLVSLLGSKPKVLRPGSVDIYAYEVPKK